MKVHVSEEGSDKVIWYKVSRMFSGRNILVTNDCLQERFLTDTEIVENLVVCPLLSVL